MDEINYLFAVENLKKQQRAGDALKSKTDLNTEIEKIVYEAKEMSNNASNGESKTSRLNGIKENRKNEKVENRKAEAFSLGREFEQTVAVESKSKGSDVKQDADDQTTMELL
jgi:hypothetical protein